jgi:filamentous hemagglutinin
MPSYRNGYPDFSEHSEATVKIENLTGNRATDAELANKAAGLDKTPEGYNWHHVEDGKTMKLLPEDMHKEFAHNGGAALLKGRN